MPYVVDFATAEDTVATTSHTGTLPTYAADDLLVWIVAKDTSQSGSFTEPSGWTRQDERSIGPISSAVFTKVAVASETAPATTNGDSDEWVSIMFSVREADTTTPVNGISGGTTGSSTEHAFPAHSTTSDDCLVLYLAGIDNNVNPAMKPGFRKIETHNTGQVSCLAYWYYQKSSGSVPSEDMYIDSSRRANTYIMSINDDGTGKYPPLLKSGTGATLITAMMSSTTLGQSASAGDPTVAGGLSTIDSITVANASATGTISNAGVNPDHGAFRFNTDDAAELQGATFTFGSSVDLSVSNRSLYFHTVPENALRAEGMGDTTHRGEVAVVHSGATPWRAFIIDARDSTTKILQPTSIVVDPNDTDELLDSNGTFAPASVDKISLLVRGFYGDYRGGVTQIGYQDRYDLVLGRSAEPVTIETLRDFQADGYLITVTKQGDAQYLALCQFQYGDGGTNETYATESNISVEFVSRSSEADKRFRFNGPDNLVGVRFAPGSGDTMTFTNVTWSSVSDFLFEIPTGGAGTLTFTSCVINGAGTTTLDDPATFSGCTFLSCGEIDNNGADLTAGNTIDSTTGAQAITVTSQAELDDLDNCTFQNNSVAIQVNVAGSITLTFDGILFSGNTTDIKYTGTGTLTANMINGANATTSSTPGGGTVNIVNTKTLTLTVKDEAGAVVSGARCRIETDPGGTLISEGTTNASGIFTDTYNYTSDQAVRVDVRLKGYVNYFALDTITTNGLSIPVSFQTDNVVNLP